MNFNVATLPIVKVVWQDAETFDEEWHTEEEIVEYIDLPLKTIHSIGWLICNDSRWVIVAQSAGNDRDGFTACNMIKIPRAMVFTVTEMNKGKRIDSEIVGGTAEAQEVADLCLTDIMLNGDVPHDMTAKLAPNGMIIDENNSIIHQDDPRANAYRGEDDYFHEDDGDSDDENKGRVHSKEELAFFKEQRDHINECAKRDGL